MSSKKDLTEAYCRLCMKNFSLAKHGVKALVMQASDSKDNSRLPLCLQTELNFGKKEEETQSAQTDQPSSQ